MADARRYAVLWSGSDGDGSGRLEVRDDGFLLAARGGERLVHLAGVTEASIVRGRAERIRGLPVLRLLWPDGRWLRIASLEGAGALYELARLAGG